MPTELEQEPITTPPPVEEAATTTSAFREEPDAVREQMDADEAAFGAGFSEARGTDEFSVPGEPTQEAETKTAPEKPAAEASASKETQVTPATAPAAAEDKWAGVPATVRQEIEGMQAAIGGMKKISEDLRRIDGHIGGQASQLKAIKDALASAKTSTEATGAAAPSAAQVGNATTKAKWDQLKEDYPDWAEAVDLRLADIAASRAPSGPAVDPVKLKQELLGEFDTRISNATTVAETKGRTFGYLDLKHGRAWENEIKSPEFDKWIEKQPEAIRKLCSSPDVDDASKLIDTFRAARKSAADKTERQKRLANSIQPRGTAVVEQTEDEEAAFQRGFEAERGR